MHCKAGVVFGMLKLAQVMLDGTKHVVESLTLWPYSDSLCMERGMAIQHAGQNFAVGAEEILKVCHRVVHQGGGIKVFDKITGINGFDPTVFDLFRNGGWFLDVQGY